MRTDSHRYKKKKKKRRK